MALEPGDKYLSLSFLGGQFNVAAFKNKKKEKDKQPDFTGNGIAIWAHDNKNRLSIKLLNSINVEAHIVKDRDKGSKQPHYRGGGVSVWVKEKQEPKKMQESIDKPITEEEQVEAPI